MFIRPHDLQPIRDDLSLLIASQMRAQATLEDIGRMLLEGDDGEEDERTDT